MEPHAEVLRRFYSQIQGAIAHPGSAATMLYEEGVVAREVVDEVTDRELDLDKKVAIMRAVSAAVEVDPNKLWGLIAVLKKFSESAPLASRMRDDLHSHGLEGERINNPLTICDYKS